MRNIRTSLILNSKFFRRRRCQRILVLGAVPRPIQRISFLGRCAVLLCRYAIRRSSDVGRCPIQHSAAAFMQTCQSYCVRVVMERASAIAMAASGHTCAAVLRSNRASFVSQVTWTTTPERPFPGRLST